MDIGIDFRELADRAKRNVISIPAIVGYCLTALQWLGVMLVWIGRYSGGLKYAFFDYIYSFAFFAPLVQLAAFILELNFLHVIALALFAIVWNGNAEVAYNARTIGSSVGEGMFSVPGVTKNSGVLIAGASIIGLTFPLIVLINRAIVYKILDAKDRLLSPYTIAAVVDVCIILLGWLLSIVSKRSGQLLSYEMTLLVLCALFLIDTLLVVEHLYSILLFFATVSLMFLSIAIIDDDALVQTAYSFVYMGVLLMLALLSYKGTVKEMNSTSGSEEEYETI